MQGRLMTTLLVLAGSVAAIGGMYLLGISDPNIYGGVVFLTVLAVGVIVGRKPPTSDTK